MRAFAQSAWSLVLPSPFGDDEPELALPGQVDGDALRRGRAGHLAAVVDLRPVQEHLED